jgi:nucleoside-diphosphate-sugar epimerase
MERLVDGAEVFFYLATGGGNTWEEYKRDFVDSARHVSEACLKHGVRRLVYTSSIAALNLGGSQPVTCDTPPDPEPLKRNLYSRGKILAELVLREMYTGSGLPVTIMRPGLVLGRGGMLNHSGLGYWPAGNYCLGWGRGNSPLPFVLVDDVADAMVAAMDASGIEGRAFNLVGDVRLSASEFVRELCYRSRRNFHFLPQSLYKMQAIEIFKWALKVAAGKKENPFPPFRDLKSRALTAPFDCRIVKERLHWEPNSDREFFLREAIDANLEPIVPGDLRVARR